MYNDLQVRAVTTFDEDITCHVTAAEESGRVVQCSYDWEAISNISISLPISNFGTPGILVTPAQGRLDVTGSGSDLGLDILGYPKMVFRGVPLFMGSHLAAAFTWTRRDIFVPQVAWGVSHPMVAIFNPEITGLQPYAAKWDANSNVSTLTLFQLSPVFTQHVVETVDSTALDGISAFGGLWTFLNGAFTLLFGANILYFALRRRPLSALGLVHMFQFGRLERQWREDFPAIHTEGGSPGTESAGIVAFIRERLVNLGEDSPHMGQSDDLESQLSLPHAEANLRD
ncbi:hypothetical protein C8R46DRAFT_1273941 [Mycena filopes]|nr:hypothetical protein C8R46DRAFT_1273941 [Mycena filopes]